MVSSVRTYKKASQYSEANPIIRGHFPKNQNSKEIAIFRLNRFLGCVLALSMAASMVSYTMVIAKESTLADIHTKTNDINFENIELQNKADYAKSFYNINDKIVKAHYLQKADSVLEVNGKNTTPVAVNNKEEIKVQPVSGY